MDRRAYDFTQTLVPAQLSDLQGAYLSVDKSGYTDAKKLDVASLLSSAEVAGSNVNYLAMTPYAFSRSYAATNKDGIIRIADDYDIANRVGDRALTGERIPQISAEIQEDILKVNGYNSPYREGQTVIGSGAAAFDYCYTGTTDSSYYGRVTPTFVSNQKGKIAIYQLVASRNGVTQVAFDSISVGQTKIYSFFRLYMDSDNIGIHVTAGGNYFTSFSGHFNIITG